MLGKLGKRAQTTAEYAILIAIVVGAIVAMQVYVRRGVQSRVRDAVDYVGNELPENKLTGFQFQTGEKGQYEPYYVTSTGSTTQTTADKEDLKTGGAVSKTSTGSTTAQREQTMGW